MSNPGSKAGHGVTDKIIRKIPHKKGPELEDPLFGHRRRNGIYDRS